MLTKRKLEMRIHILEKEVLGKLNEDNLDAKYYYHKYSLQSQIYQVKEDMKKLEDQIYYLLKYLVLEYVEKIDEEGVMRKFYRKIGE